MGHKRARSVPGSLRPEDDVEVEHARPPAAAASAAEIALDPGLSRVEAVPVGLERDFGRRGGRRVGRACSTSTSSSGRGGTGAARARLPGSGLRTRLFVLAPLAEAAPDWRDPSAGECPASAFRLPRPRG